MKFRSLHNWVLSDDVVGLLYFAQRMDELLFDFSLDSFKPPALNPVSLCSEAIDYIKDVEGGEVDIAGLSPILDELKYIISNDPISKGLLELPLEQYVLSSDETPIDQKKLRLEVLRRTLDSELFFINTVEYLSKAVQENKKKHIGHAAKMLVSIMISQGMSKTYLYKQTQDYFFSGTSSKGKISSPTDIIKYLELIAPIHHEFDVFFLVSEEILLVKDSLHRFRIKILDSLPENLRDFGGENNFIPDKGEVLVEITEIRGFDCYSVRQEAERRIDTLRDLFTLYFHRCEMKWRDETLISQCCVESPKIVNSAKSPMQKAFDSSAAFASKRLNYLLSNLSLRIGDGQSFLKFNRIVDLHGISVTNEVPENQLLNLWISMETLVPAGKKGQNAIGRIVSSLEPFIQCTYIARLIDHTYADLTLWNSFITRKILRSVEDTKGLRGNIKLLTLLAIQTEANKQLLNDLYTELRDFHLLRNRIFRLTEILKSPASIATAIHEHSKRVGWQIRRIYRTRNMLVHSGRTPNYLDALIENGHDYLDLVLDSIIALSCGPLNIQSLEQAFEYQKLQMVKLDRTLKNQSILNWDDLQVLFHPEWKLKYNG